MKKYFILLFILSTPVITTAQESKISKGNKGFDNYNYVNAQNVYQKVADKGYESADLYKRLGDSYYLNASYEKAQIWYGKLIEKYADNIEAETYFRYAISLKGTKNYKRSDEIMTRFKDLKSNDKRALLFSEDPDYLRSIEKNKNTYQVTETSINSGYSDFGTAFYNDKLIFSSAKDTGDFVKRIHKWNGQPFLDLYEVPLEMVSNDEVTYKDAKKFNKSINSPFHESTPTFTKDGNTVYFTRNNYNNGVYRDDIDGTNKLKIYKAVKNDKGRWGNIEELPFSSNDYTIAHPSLSPDEKRLYFSSDMPGTFGNADLWYVTIQSDGTYSAPVNLGNEINTEGRESYPFISQENDLYFASNGHLGLGGLDIFKTTLGENGEATEIINLGEPVNTSKDDFSFIINTTSNIGFLSSNRNNEAGNDDIYKLERLKPLEPPCIILLNGLVTDKDTGEKINNVTVTLYDTNKNVFGTSVTDANATFSFDPSCDKEMLVRAEKEGYIPEERIITIPATSAELEALLQLEKKNKPLEPGKDLSDILNLNPIYFDFDRFNIRPDAAEELAKVLVVLEEYPTMRIDVRSHTDSRGNDSYNQRLSQNRNDATIQWLVDKGISRSRLTGRGYGESSPVNECTNNVACSEAAHQDNRRSEFIILGDR
ncbi:OmpA family protein [uncultured Dokdonia sp.]|uniref:OmpA family protein n=1 Tax=uncultured Dokdonia sp. TaxID=575653 RepID=UPI002629A27E|nr:OmpA family protein [uncultured Dokdonia sp.]